MITTVATASIKSVNEKFLMKGIRVKTPSIAPKIALNIDVCLTICGFIYYLISFGFTLRILLLVYHNLCL